jgi:dihydropyrimidinase
MDDFHIGNYSIWEGWEVVGWPVTTILRGKVMVENAQFFGKEGDGQFIPRKIAADILNRPAC